jgi:hypothetical protein
MLFVSLHAQRNSPFSRTFIEALGSTEKGGLPPVVKRSGREADHSPPDKNE